VYRYCVSRPLNSIIQYRSRW